MVRCDFLLSWLDFQFSSHSIFFNDIVLSKLNSWLLCYRQTYELWKEYLFLSIESSFQTFFCNLLICMSEKCQTMVTTSNKNLACHFQIITRHHGQFQVCTNFDRPEKRPADCSLASYYDPRHDRFEKACRLFSDERSGFWLWSSMRVYPRSPARGLAVAASLCVLVT